MTWTDAPKSPRSQTAVRTSGGASKSALFSNTARRQRFYCAVMKRTATLRWVILLLAQWVHYPASGIPRLPDGSPDLAAPGSTHDLTGTWTLPATRLGGPDGPPK